MEVSLVEVPDHLAPMELRNGIDCAFDALFNNHHGGGTFRFVIKDDANDDQQIGNFQVTVGPKSGGDINSLVVEAHRRAIDVLRQSIFRLDRMAQAYDGSESG